MPTLADLFGTYYLVNPGGVDFSSIRVHYAGAGRECRAVHASAFTVGSDIYFAGANGFPVPYEIEHYVAASGHLTAWASIDLEPGGAMAYLYYGGGSAAPDTPALWTSYAAVYPAVPAGRYAVWGDGGVPVGPVVISGGQVARFHWPG